jgi:hypothetical protein
MNVQGAGHRRLASVFGGVRKEGAILSRTFASKARR